MKVDNGPKITLDMPALLAHLQNEKLTSNEDTKKREAWKKCEALLKACERDEGIMEQLAMALLRIGQDIGKSNDTFAAVCFALHYKFEVSLNEIAEIIEADTGRRLSKGWISRLMSGHQVLLMHPGLADIKDQDRLYLLSRVPEAEMATVVQSGNYMGCNIRKEKIATLRSKISKSPGKKNKPENTPTTIDVPTSVDLKNRYDDLLTALASKLGVVFDLLDGLDDKVAADAKITLSKAISQIENFNKAS